MKQLAIAAARRGNRRAPSVRRHRACPVAWLAIVVLALAAGCFDSSSTRRRARQRERLPLPPPSGSGSLEHLFTDEEREARAERFAAASEDVEVHPAQTIPPSTRVAGLIDTGAWVLNVRGKVSRSRGDVPNPERPLITDRRVLLNARQEGDAVRVEIELPPSTRRQRQDAQVFRGWLTDDPIEDGAKILRATGRDQAFEYQLVGKLHSPQRLSGTFLAIDPTGERSGMHGIFELEGDTDGHSTTISPGNVDGANR